jgi:hypothetical protein
MERDGEEEHDSKQTLRQVNKTAQATNEDERAVLWGWREGTHDDRLTCDKYTTNRRSMAKRGERIHRRQLLNAAVTTPM